MSKLCLVAIITLVVAGCASLPNTGNRIPVEFTLCEYTPSPGLAPRKVTGLEREVYLRGQAVLSTVHIASAQVTESQYGGTHHINITFTKEGTSIFAEVTRNNLNKPLAIIVEGEVISAPVIRTEIAGGKAVISGKFTQEEAQRIASGIMGE
jgi:SecD/SecF fusion protein